MLRTALAAIATSAALLGASAAHAGVQWSIGINLPGPAVVVDNGGYYVQQPAPVYVAPQPVYVQQPMYAPQPAYLPAPVYQAAPVVYREPAWAAEAAYPDWRSERQMQWARHRAMERAHWDRDHGGQHRHDHHDDERRW